MTKARVSKLRKKERGDGKMKTAESICMAFLGILAIHVAVAYGFVAAISGSDQVKHLKYNRRAEETAWILSLDCCIWQGKDAS